MEEIIYMKWNNHTTAMLKQLSHVKAKEKFCDATIACQGTYFPVHRFVLSMCSEYFDEIFDKVENNHPFIILKDVSSKEMKELLNYMYFGEVKIEQNDLHKFIAAAESLKIRGLAVLENNYKTKNLESPIRNMVTEEQGLISLHHREPLEEENYFNGFESDMNSCEIDPSEKCEAVFNQSFSQSDEDIKDNNLENQYILKTKQMVKEKQSSNRKSSKFKCAFCKFKSNKKSMVKKHAFVEHGKEMVKRRASPVQHGKKKPFSCKECGVRFTRSYNLKRHMMIHSGNYRFSCERCGKKFTKHYYLKSHLEKKVQCKEILMKSGSE